MHQFPTRENVKHLTCSLAHWCDFENAGQRGFPYSAGSDLVTVSLNVQLHVWKYWLRHLKNVACFPTEIRVSPTKPCGKGSKRKQDELEDEEEEEHQTWVEALNQELADDDSPEEDPDYEVGARFCLAHNLRGNECLSGHAELSL